MDKCPNCGARVEGTQCLYCGSTFKGNQEKQPFQNQAYQHQAHQISTVQNQTSVVIIPQKKQLITLVLCFFFGYFGIHYLYLNRHKMFLLYLFTCGLLGFGYFIDLIRIIMGFIKDGNGQYLV